MIYKFWCTHKAFSTYSVLCKSAPHSLTIQGLATSLHPFMNIQSYIVLYQKIGTYRLILSTYDSIGSGCSNHSQHVRINPDIIVTLANQVNNIAMQHHGDSG